MSEAESKFYSTSAVHTTLTNVMRWCHAVAHPSPSAPGCMALEIALLAHRTLSACDRTRKAYLESVAAGTTNVGVEKHWRALNRSFHSQIVTTHCTHVERLHALAVVQRVCAVVSREKRGAAILKLLEGIGAATPKRRKIAIAAKSMFLCIEREAMFPHVSLQRLYTTEVVPLPPMKRKRKRSATRPSSPIRPIAADANTPDVLVCTICLENLKDRVLTRCGHTMCCACVERLRKIDKRCPTCRTKITPLGSKRFFL